MFYFILPLDAHCFSSVSRATQGMGDALFCRNKNNNNQYENSSNRMDNNDKLTDKICSNEALSKQNKILSNKKREKYRKMTNNKNTQNKNESSLGLEDKNNTKTNKNSNICLLNVDETRDKNDHKNSFYTKNNTPWNDNAEEEDVDDWFSKFDDDGNAFDMESLNEV